jgi:multicomponent Na+:H+ antiporter subunit B
VGSVIIATTARVLLPVFLIFSIFLLWRGHNEPGGGFTGGLVAASGFVLYGMAFGPEAVRAALKINLKSLIGIGLALALLSGLLGLFAGLPFFKALWVQFSVLDGQVKLGTPLLFDVGVYFVVIGVVLTIVLARSEEE